ncbi:MAG: arsenate reductase [Bacteroidetes bacterium]|nr:arsenate reductase [Bacteroidota bacterium]
MKKTYFLSTCKTCKVIIDESGLRNKGFELQNIKIDRITPEQLDEMKQLAGTYEALFSRKSLKYKALNLKDKKLTEQDYRKFILEEYSFLKRPVTIMDKQIFIGNDKKTVEALKTAVAK